MKWWDFAVWNIDENQPVMYVKNLVHLFGCRIDLHQMIRPDLPECFHTHPAHAYRLCLWGGYIEEALFPGYSPPIDRAKLEVWPGFFGPIEPEYCHRLHALPKGSSWSLWFRGRVCAEIKLVGSGWPEHMLNRDLP